MKIVLIGAGSAQFGLGMVGDIFQSRILEGCEIDLVDINSEALSHVYQKTISFKQEHSLPFIIKATTDRTEVLPNADVVVISVEVGNRFKLWDIDWTLPQQYGIHQVYGENGGAGGVFHALRITPIILDICDDIVKYCPNAYVFNYSNPMTAITTTVLRKYPHLKLIGMCHEIASIKKYVPFILQIPYEELQLRAAGLNHFSVLLSALRKPSGEDVYPQLLKKALAFFATLPGYSDLLEQYRLHGTLLATEGSSEVLPESLTNKRQWADRCAFRFILQNYHLLPITTDSHIGEYIAWAHEIVDHRGIKDFYEYYQLLLSRENPQIDTILHERLVPILEGIACDSKYEEPAVNIRNEALIPDLPSWVVVEVPGIIDKTGIKGVAFPDYPKGFLSLLRSYTGVYDLTAEAVLSRKKEYVIQALLANPVIDICKNIPELTDMMIEKQHPWLDYLS